MHQVGFLYTNPYEIFGASSGLNLTTLELGDMVKIVLLSFVEGSLCVVTWLLHQTKSLNFYY